MAEAGFRVHGRVQGVGFRWWTRNEAVRLELQGSVRNREDGTVEVRVRGRDDAVLQLRERLRHGPPGARVERVEEIASGPVIAGKFVIEG
jgi:acylphosphatase